MTGILKIGVRLSSELIKTFFDEGFEESLLGDVIAVVEDRECERGSWTGGWLLHRGRFFKYRFELDPSSA